MPRNSPIPNVEFRDFSILAELHNHYHNLTIELFTIPPKRPAVVNTRFHFPPPCSPK